MRRLAAAVTVTVLAGVLAACSTTDDGSVVEGGSDTVEGSPATLATPLGALDVVVGEPVDGVAAGDALDGEDHDGTFVPVSWELDRSSLPRGSAWLNLGDPVLLDLAVTVDGETWPVGRAYGIDTGDVDGLMVRRAASAYVAVPGDPAGDDVELVVSFDGEQQTVASDGSVDAGRFADLDVVADEPGRDARCAVATDVRLDAGRLEALSYCAATPLTLSPYVAGVGWAPEGRLYALARVVRGVFDSGVTLDPRRGPLSEYDMHRREAPGATESVASLEETAVGGDSTLDVDEVQVFEVDADATTLRLDLSLRWHLVKVYGPGPRTLDVPEDDVLSLRFP